MRNVAEEMARIDCFHYSGPFWPVLLRVLFVMSVKLEKQRGGAQFLGKKSRLTFLNNCYTAGSKREQKNCKKTG